MTQTYKAEINLMPAESKKLIAMAVCELPEVKRAFKEGIIYVKSQTTNYFILRELMEWAGRRGEPVENFVCGMNQPLGTCQEAARSALYLDRRLAAKAGKKPAPLVMPQYAFEKGEAVCVQDDADSWVFKMTKSDVYISGANAIDPAGKLGIQCWGAHVGTAEKPRGGTIQRHLPYLEKYNIPHLVPVGIEKMIPVSIEEASRAAPMGNLHARIAGDCIYSDGTPMGLLPFKSPPAIAITEVEAFRILTGTKAVPFGAGGILGAEGSVQLMITGSREEVEQAIELRAGQLRGATIPGVKVSTCEECFQPCIWSRQWDEIQEDFAKTKFAKQGLKTYPWLDGVAAKYRSRPFYDPQKTRPTETYVTEDGDVV
ncbi:MAG: hypothetical protein ABSD41_11410 [Candidatus Bathyarchaeia archaeon]